MKDIQEYLNNNFGLEANAEPLDKNEQQTLPLYLREGYRLYRGQVAGKTVIWAEFAPKSHYTPDQLQKQGQQLKQFLDNPIVFVITGLESWERKRLIERKVAFVQPNKQLYIPELLLQLSDVLSTRQKQEKELEEFLSFPAQSLLLYHLERSSLENKKLQEIAELLRYSAMTISRAVQELQIFNLIEVEGSKGKSIKFLKEGKELFENALPFLRSPVREIWFTDEKPENKNFFIAGEMALSVHTLLSTVAQETYAIGKDAFRSLFSGKNIKSLDKKNGGILIEVWQYDPALLSSVETADRLSLYLSFREGPDERVKGALEELINEMKW